MSAQRPLVSIITPTYNRGNVLGYAIASVLNSAFEDWEQLVVGDGCTDDTEQVVASVNDPRIHFINLESNSGFESTPNNEAFRRSRGRYIAYLHQDDLWLPRHLDVALEGIGESGADMVFTMGVSLMPGGGNRILGGALRGDAYFPSHAVPISLWFARREFIEEIGPWPQPQDALLEPGQDLLIRAWRAGKRILRLPVVTVVKIHAGTRPDVYRKREFEENRAAFERMQSEPGFPAGELAEAFLNELRLARPRGAWACFRAGLGHGVRRVALAAGITPMELNARLTHRRKGAIAAHWRRKVGAASADKSG